MNTATQSAAAPTRLPGWLVLAGLELRLIARNKTIALTATALPLGLVILLSMSGQAATGSMAAMHLVMLLGFTVYMTATMTLAHHRASLFLKRLRSSATSDAGIVAGLSVAPVTLFLAQSVLLFGGLALAGQPGPQRPAVLVVAAVVGAITCAGLAFLTASFTRSPEAAHITTTPGFGLLMGGMIWALTTPGEVVNLPMLAVPGGAVTQLVRYSFAEPGMTAQIGLVQPVVASIAVAVVCCLIAARLFTWEPRA